MTPSQIAKTSESSHQQALFFYCVVACRQGWKAADEWCDTGKLTPVRSNANGVCALEWLHSIPNGGLRSPATGAKLKAEGVKKGVPDCFLPYSVGKWHGLYIEMKKPSLKPKTDRSTKGGLSDDQIKFKNYCLRVDYGFVTCYSWIEAVEVLKQYINHKE